MADFSEKEINEAKRRVWEMQNRAAHYVGENEQKSSSNQSIKQNNFQQNEREKISNTNAENEKENDNESEKDKEKSFLVILALILLLSQEEADNKLILALLYLLL